MKTLNRYVGSQLLISFAVTLTVLTFIMLSAGIVAGVNLLSKGLDFSLFIKFVGFGMPKALGLAIPMALLTATILVFSRMSADNEITAMRAGGVSIWQIITPCLFLSLFISIFCLWLQLEIIPASNQAVRDIKKSSAIINPRLLLEPGRPIELFSGFIVYIDQIERIDDKTDKLQDVHIYQLNDKGQVVKDIVAPEGTLVHDKKERQFLLTLQQANTTIRHGTQLEKVDRLKGSTTFPLRYGEQMSSQRVNRKNRTLGATGLFAKIQLNHENGVDSMPLYVELNKRMALALCPFAFLLLGIPFGIRTSRSETSVGLVISVGLAVLFYVFIIIAENLSGNPELHPDFLIWLPNVIYQLGGIFAINKISRR
ncbi:MAG: LptF/LptG family permease [Lentisphaeria bacterium]|nr:LptF/LptG family permease [Lentisphaeria bacterium]